MLVFVYIILGFVLGVGFALVSELWIDRRGRGR